MRTAIPDNFVSLDAAFEWPCLDRGRFQTTLLESRAQAIHYCRNLRPGQFHRIHTNKMGKIVIEIDEIETDSPIFRAGNSDLAPAQAKRF